MNKEFDLIHSPLSGNNIIEASAGTGKTYSIEGLYVRALLRTFLEPDSAAAAVTTVDKILVVTYTEAATAELKIRIQEKLNKTLKGFKSFRQLIKSLIEFDEQKIQDSREIISNDSFVQELLLTHSRILLQEPDRLINDIIDHLKLALLSFDEASIFTIHGFCRRMLADYSLEAKSGFEFEFTTNQQLIIDEVVNDYWRNHAYHKNLNYAEAFLSFFPTPNSIAVYLLHTINKPYVHLEPASAPLRDNWFEESSKQFQDLKKAWLKGKKEIEELIEASKTGLYKKYLDSVPELFQQVNDYFDGDSPFQLPKLAKNFTPEVVQKNTKTKNEPFSHTFLDLFDSFYRSTSLVKERLIVGLIPILIEAFRKKKEELHLLSFDDLLIRFNEALRDSGGERLVEKIRTRFDVALIDEFQDTDPIQYEIFHRLFHSKRPLFLIGDPKQSIYNFRGADIFAYFKAIEENPAVSQLSINWRSCTDLVKAFNTIFSEEIGNGPFVFKEKIQYSASKGASSKPARSLVVEGKEPAPFQIWFHEGDPPVSSAEIQELIQQATVREIVRLLNLAGKGLAVLKSGENDLADSALEPKDIAILVSSHNQAKRFQHALRNHNVPSVLRSTGSIFETLEFKEMKILLKGIHEFNNERSLKPVFATEIFDFRGNELLALFEDEDQWESQISHFQHLKEIWHQKGLFVMLQQFMESNGIRENFLQFEEGERKLTNFLQITEILHRIQMEKQLDASSLIQWMNVIQQTPQDFEDHEIRLETDDDALSILTVHASKGLQFPVVFCPYSWGTGMQTGEVIFHDPDNSDRLTWDLEKQGKNKETAAKERLAEQIRLSYVAFTRAKAACYVSWGRINKYKNSCFNHLFHPSFSKLKGSYSDIPVDAYWKDLKQLESRSEGSIKISTLPLGDSGLYSPEKTQEPVLEVRKNKIKLIPNSGNFSFSRLTKKEEFIQTEPDTHDLGEVDDTPMIDESVAIDNLLDFPGGKTTGNLFHSILERVDFQADDSAEDLVNTTLKQFGFDEKWNSQVLGLVKQLKTFPFPSDFLKGSSFSLALLQPTEILREMPFYFTLNQVKLEQAKQLIKNQTSIPSHDALLNSLDSIPFRELNGFMNGFIDLVFVYQERYYLLDWKTNKLGNNTSDYTPKQLEAKINEFGYNLQFYIYTIALHKYLKFKIPDYKFKDHFGGVYYVFLRGLSGETGLFYTSLMESADLIEGLDNLFLGEEDG